MNTDTQQPEALRHADFLEEINQNRAAAELRRLHQYEVAYTDWLDKTEWVQDTAQPHELGMHRADVIKQRFDRLHAINHELLEALQNVTLVCENVHHGKKDRHSFAEPCPVTVRIRAAIARAESTYKAEAA